MRHNAMSRTDRPNPPTSSDVKRPRRFTLRDDLYDAFEARARELECSVDWLLAEAMKRLLANPRLAARSLPPPPQPPQPQRSAAFVLPPPPPPPPPPPQRRATGSFVGSRSEVERLAVRMDAVRIALEGTRMILGRSAKDAQIVVRDGSVSRQHAMLERGEEGWFIVDMASTNGVLLNGARVARARVRPGDVLGIGPVSLFVERA
jgi:Inner membrane component of T3SS, cytoplasmic domain